MDSSKLNFKYILETLLFFSKTLLNSSEILVSVHDYVYMYEYSVSFVSMTITQIHDVWVHTST